MKSCTIKFSGTVRIAFDIKSSAGDTGNGRIYKNGVAFGTEQSSTDTYQTFSEDLAFKDGDTIAVDAKRITGTVYVKNFRIYYTITMGCGIV
jgi:hypothetical protein